MDNHNLIMMARIGVHNEGSIQISGEGYTFLELEKTKYQLMDLGYDCQIVEDLKELYLVVSSSVK